MTPIVRTLLCLAAGAVVLTITAMAIYLGSLDRVSREMDAEMRAIRNERIERKLDQWRGREYSRPEKLRSER